MLGLRYVVFLGKPTTAPQLLRLANRQTARLDRRVISPLAHTLTGKIVPIPHALCVNFRADVLIASEWKSHGLA